MRKYIKTAVMTVKNHTNAGIFYLLPDYILRLVYLIPLFILWRVLMAKGVEVGMSLDQMLTYTLISNLLGELLVIRSPLTHWIISGPLISVYQRPMGIYGHIIAQSLGDAVPGLVFFSLPMTLCAPLFGVKTIPASLWFLPSLALCVTLGFAFEFLFACMLVHMINASWLVFSIRNAVTWLFSGTLIPFLVLPFGLGDVFRYLPLGSLGGAPLSIFTGTANALHTIGVQVFWNVTIWPVTILAFQKTQEKLTSHGG